MKKIKALIFYWLIRPILNRFGGTQVRPCPMCGELLDHYESHGFLHRDAEWKSPADEWRWCWAQECAAECAA